MSLARLRAPSGVLLSIVTSHTKELQTSITALALAWVAKNPNTATVILGASKPEQITQNLAALELIPRLTPEILHKIDKILSNAPETLVCFVLLFVFLFLMKHLAVLWPTISRQVWTSLSKRDELSSTSYINDKLCCIFVLFM